MFDGTLRGLAWGESSQRRQPHQPLATAPTLSRAGSDEESDASEEESDEEEEDDDGYNGAPVFTGTDAEARAPRQPQPARTAPPAQASSPQI